MPTLKGRQFFFATRADLTPGLMAVERTVALDFVLHELRDDTSFSVLKTLSDHPQLGETAGHDANNSPTYLTFRRGGAPSPRAIKQRRGGVKYEIGPTSACVILRCGGCMLRAAP